MDPQERLGRLLPLVSNRHEGALPIQQDAEVYAATLERGKAVRHEFQPGQDGYLYVISGAVAVGGETPAAGDAAKITGEPAIELTAQEDAHLLLAAVDLEA